MSTDDGPAAPPPDILAVVQHAMSCESPQALEQWTVEHRDAVNEDFFSALEYLSRLARKNEQPAHASLFAEVASFVRSVLDRMRATERQADLLSALVAADSTSAFAAVLRDVVSKIDPAFFVLLARIADAGNREGDLAIEVCERMLDVIGFNDLREDWPEPQRTIIWGAAWVPFRHTGLRALINEANTDRPISGEFLKDAIEMTFNLAAAGNMASIALAVLNVIFAVCGRAVSPSGASAADEIRHLTLFMAAKVIRLRGGEEHLEKGKRLLEAAHDMLPRLRATASDALRQHALAANAAALLDTMSDFALADDQASEAERLAVEALRQHEEVLAQARADALPDEEIARLSLGVPNSLVRLGGAKVRQWQLDDADRCYQLAVAEYRRLGKSGRMLAGHLESWARIAFLRADLPAAEAYLAEAQQLSQEPG